MVLPGGRTVHSQGSMPSTFAGCERSLLRCFAEPSVSCHGCCWSPETAEGRMALFCHRAPGNRMLWLWRSRIHCIDYRADTCAPETSGGTYRLRHPDAWRACRRTDPDVDRVAGVW